MRQIASNILWQKDRNVLNHDELKNKFITTLERLLAIVAGRSESSMSLAEAHEKLTIWPQRSADAKMLLRRFEKEMTPAILFETLPLSNCSPAKKAWLLPLIHKLWMIREMIVEKVNRASECLAKADTEYISALSTLERLDELKVNKSTQKAIERLRIACQDFTTILSTFPHNIEVV